MENKKYKVCRNDIYVGQVIKTSEIYQYSNDDTKEKLTHLRPQEKKDLS